MITLKTISEIWSFVPLLSNMNFQQNRFIMFIDYCKTLRFEKRSLMETRFLSRKDVHVKTCLFYSKYIEDLPQKWQQGITNNGKYVSE